MNIQLLWLWALSSTSNCHPSGTQSMLPSGKNMNCVQTSYSLSLSSFKADFNENQSLKYTEALDVWHNAHTTVAVCKKQTFWGPCNLCSVIDTKMSNLMHNIHNINRSLLLHPHTYRSYQISPRSLMEGQWLPLTCIETFMSLLFCSFLPFRWKIPPIGSNWLI